MGVKGFAEGGIASIIAGCSTHPLDLIKVRMQLQGESPSFAFHPGTGTAISAIHLRAPPSVGPVAVGMNILRSEGVAALFSGVSATVLRQTLYSTTRMGLYDVLKTKWTNPQTGNMPLVSKITAGLIAGGIGAAVGNPADVAMVRMQATHVTASFAAGFVASVASNPVDVIKTRVMNMTVEAGKAAPYSGALDCAIKTVKAEGPMALYKGFIPTISRQGPFTVVLFVTLEQVRKLLKDF
ncbi:Mitochondrial uncoupling protein 4 [Linum grandiflorum]